MIGQVQKPIDEILAMLDGKEKLVSSLINGFNHLTAFARICSAVFVHTKDLAPSFHRLRKAFVDPISWATLSKLPLRMA